MQRSGTIFVHAARHCTAKLLEFSTLRGAVGLTAYAAAYAARLPSLLYNAAKAKAMLVSGKYPTAQDKSKTAQRKYEMVHGNIAGVIAQSSVWKTTLAKLLVQKIIFEYLYDVDCIFYLRFRDIDYKNNMNLLQFLTDNTTFASTITGENLS